MKYTSKYVSRGDAIQDVRSHKDLLCNVILFVGHTICVASSISMMIWCDHCLLVAFRFRFHIELAKCLLFGVRSSYLSPKCARHNTCQNTTREKWCTPRKSSISSCSCLGSLKQLLFFSYSTSPWLSSFSLYLFVGIALMAWPKDWSVGIDHCSVCDCFHGKVSNNEAGLRH